MSEHETREPTGSPSPVPLAASLRILGALALVAAAGSYLWQSWSGMGDVTRYALLWAQTALVWGAGWVCGVRLRARKAARTLLGLVFAVTPVHFAVVGGMLYSRLPLDAPPARTSASLLWVATSLPEALLVAALAVLSLGVMSRLSLRVFDRQLESRDFWACAITWAALLVPVRDPASSLGLAAATTALALAVRGAPRTGSGTASWARSALWAGSLLFAGRTAVLYGLDISVWAAAALFLPAAAVHVSAEPGLHASLRTRLRQFARLALAAAWAGPAYLVAERFALSLEPLLLASAWFALSLSRGFDATAPRSRSRWMPSLSIALVAVGLSTEGGWLPMSCALGLATLLWLHGSQWRDRPAVTSGALAFVMAIGIHAVDNLAWPDLWHSWNLAGLGLGCVLLAALLERKPSALRDAVRNAQRRWSHLDDPGEGGPEAQDGSECEPASGSPRNVPTRALS